MNSPTHNPPDEASKPPDPIDDWTAVRQLFDAAAEQPAGGRAAFVDAAAATEAVKAEVRSLLAHAGNEATAGAFLHAPAAAQLLGQAQAPRDGQHFGAWQIVRPVGAGGMGEVFEARRADGSFEGRAAIKLLKRGMDSAAVLRRFAVERQTLARLNHPNVATLFDAGLSADGLPYFVMEFVDGVPIDEAARALPIEQRLALFLQLADAVSHAHRNLLVHRDLKPGNVLVTRDGKVKLLDFGIAKAIDPADSADADAIHQLDTTVGAVRPFTPNYASPEQIRGEPVSTATDIYSLGVLLYQLLTGVRPTGRSATTPVEAARSVLEETPTRPSALSPAQAQDPHWLTIRKRLEGDLDNILLKALDKDVERRYASVEAMAADIRANLGGYPVSARPPSVGYLMSRFVGRNRVGVAAALLALLAVLAGAGVAVWQAREAEAQRVLAERRFDEVRQFARTMLFDVDTALRDGPTAGREKLVATALQYLDRLSAERLADNALLRDVAEAYERVGEIQGGNNQANLGRPKEARISQGKALALRERLAAQAPSDLQNLRGLASTHARLGDLTRGQGRLEEAAGHYEKAVQHTGSVARALPGDLKAQLSSIEARRYLSSVDYWPFHKSRGQYTRARQVVEALSGELDALLARHPAEADVLAQYGALLNQLTEFQRIAGEFAATLATQRTSNELARRLLATAPDNPRWQRWMFLAEGYLADALFGTGDAAGGLAMWQASIARREAVVRADPADERAQRNLANGYGPLAEALDALGRHAEALSWYQRENALLRTLRQRHPDVKALAPRLDESDRDLALQFVLTGHASEGVARQRELDARRGAAVNTAPADGDDAKFALLRARVLRAAPPGLVGADEIRNALAQARAGLAVLRADAAAEPFNALLAREAALGAHLLAVSLAFDDAAGACALLREASTALDALAVSGRLPATVVEQRVDARQRAERCAA